MDERCGWSTLGYEDIPLHRLGVVPVLPSDEAAELLARSDTMIMGIDLVPFRVNAPRGHDDHSCGINAETTI